MHVPCAVPETRNDHPSFQILRRTSCGCYIDSTRIHICAKLVSNFDCNTHIPRPQSSLCPGINVDEFYSGILGNRTQRQIGILFPRPWQQPTRRAHHQLSERQRSYAWPIDNWLLESNLCLDSVRRKRRATLCLIPSIARRLYYQDNLESQASLH